MKFQTQNTTYHNLKSKWIKTHRRVQKKLWDNHGQSLNWLKAGAMGGMMLLASPNVGLLANGSTVENAKQLIDRVDQDVFLAAELKDHLPSEVRKLDPAEESVIGDILSNSFGFLVKPEIDGIRLNRSYGLIGGEQHLYRYPGDHLYQHADTTSDWAMFGDAGIAPGLGAWGYFASSKGEFSEQDKLRERYYIAVQTFLTPGYNENVKKYSEFFRYRKMLVVNPRSGQAVVTDIADAGPSEYTGKHLGGSPEVMHLLGLAGGPRKGAVLYFFIDDPKDIVPLGSIKAKAEKK